MLYASDKLTGKKPPALNSTLLLRSCIEKCWSCVEISRSSDWRRSNLSPTIRNISYKYMSMRPQDACMTCFFHT